MSLMYRVLASLDTSPLPTSGSDGTNAIFVSTLNVVFGVLAALAFMTIVYGGFKYTTSRGEPDRLSKAKDTILYALVGLVISFSGFGIVNFLLKSF